MTDYFVQSSPAELCPTGRTVDIDALLSVIDKANKFVYVAVMDYFPALIYSKPQTYDDSDCHEKCVG